MSNFFFVFFALLIAGYAALALLGAVLGVGLAVAVVIVALVALLLSMLISQNEKLDALRKEVAELRVRLDGADKPTEESSSGGSQ